MKYLQNSPLLCVFITPTNIRYKPWSLSYSSHQYSNHKSKPNFLFTHSTLYMCSCSGTFSETQTLGWKFAIGERVLRSSSKHDDDGAKKNVISLHILTMKTVVSHDLHELFFIFVLSQTFSSPFPRREMTCLAIVWTTWAFNDKFSTFSPNLQTPHSNLIPR